MPARLEIITIWPVFRAAIRFSPAQLAKFPGSPAAGLLESKVDEDGKELQTIKTVLLASMQGYAPQVAIEFGRKVLYSTERPTFAELEAHVKKK